MSGLTARVVPPPRDGHPVVSAGLDRALRVIKDQLRQPREMIERAFLETGESLTSCAVHLQDIGRTFESLEKSLEGDDVKAATARLARIPVALREMDAGIDEKKSLLAQLTATVDAGRRPVDDLVETMQMINVVAINARVVSALVANKANDLSVFTSDISILSTHAAATINRFAKVYQHLLQTLDQAKTVWSRFETDQAKTLAVLSGKIDHSLSSIAEQQEKAISNSVETARFSRTITEKLSQAVFALQIGDITRQRVEHVEEAIETALENDTRVDDRSWLITAVATCRLQQTQMKQALADFGRETQQIFSSLSHLATETEHALTSTGQVYSVDESDGKSFLAELGNELTSACALVRTYEHAYSGILDAAASVSSSVAEMLTYVDSIGKIESDLRIVSLNMSLKCRRLALEGRALDVIAHELRELVTQTVRSSRAIRQHLNEACAVAHSLKDNGTANQSEQTGRLEQRVTLSIEALQQADKDMTAALGLLRRSGAFVLQRLRSGRTWSLVRGDILQRLSACTKNLEDVAQIEVSDHESCALLQSTMLRLSSKYTMVSERLLHQSLQERQPSDQELGRIRRGDRDNAGSDWDDAFL